MTLTLVTPPAAEVVTLDALRDHLRVTGTSENDVIRAMQAAAVGYLDGWHGVLGRAILPQVWRQEFGGWGVLPLALPDVTAVAVTWLDADGNEQPADSAVLRKCGPAYVVEASGPSAASRVFVNMTCGLPAERIEAARIVVKMLVAHWYSNREAVGAPMAEVPLSAEALIGALRWRQV